MSSKGKRLKRTALATSPTAPAALAAVAVVPVGAVPVGRQAKRRGVGAIVKAGIESAVVVKTETGIVIGGEAVGAEVEIGSVVTAAEAGIVDIAVSHEVETGVERIVCATGVHRLHKYGRSKSPHFREKSPVREPVDNLSPEERDARTVFCMQLAARIRPRDLEDFFSAVGKVRDVRIISDRNSRRSKGIAYVEFCEIQSVPLAIGLTGQRLLGVPIIVQASQAEKNRLAAMANNLQKGSGGPMRLYVGSLHFNITEDMLRGIFEPFGKIDNIVLMKDSDTGRSKGYGFITFSDSECARRALEQLNGFELAGRPMRVGHVTERPDGGTDITFPDGDQELDLGSAGGRLQLMAKLAEESGIQLPTTAATAAAAAQAAALQLNGAVPLGALNPAALTGRLALGKGGEEWGLDGRNALCSLTPLFVSALSPALNLASQAIASQCFQLSSLFTPQTMPS
nr:probable RNA-binding protein 23 isoform X7 [Camelus dromedarius]XP_031308568.1 probable RNA-binding protein 23 isoform X7 [Camelus dromedarius]XP_031308569.1 probable RNA-binding protein 23 isoform X7 [Camelus dromedarius]XP_031308570.1 probable RNA-binding protein 23 isoform X7 [Camelus dromedarius]XP_031308571.1 probable RNA-binding protein 23 isoform X7 [Camelus dromedarius]XP_031308572.1 probable RNA-binding protein 23 isoform X7 [Camelus dromedarius]XP_031311644.1 probable RNA-binding